MTPVSLEDLLLPAGVSMLHAWQLAGMARAVGMTRMKYKVDYPAITGDENFMRAFRAQQNTIEFTPIFFPLLWGASLFFHPVPAALAGLVYIYGRRGYFKGYCVEVKGRLPGFYNCVRAIKGLMFMASVGLIHCGLVTYAGVDVKQMVMDRFSK